MSRQGVFGSLQSLALDGVFMSRQSNFTLQQSLAKIGIFRLQ